MPSAVEKRIKEFIDTYGSGIARSIANTGLFFPAMVAQSAWESGYGDRIPPNSYNFAGIKYNPNLPNVVGYVDVDTTEYINGKKVFVKRRFSKFKDVASGFEAHKQVLMSQRYTKARLDAKSPEEQLEMIARAGYSTTPSKLYASQMQSLVNAARNYSKLGRIV